jgi:sigma-B regulation protein RsbU (phosphoserine phosphatase)
MNRQARIILTGGLLVMMTLNLCGMISSQLLPLAGSSTGIRVDWSRDRRLLVIGIDPEGPTAGRLKPGDELIAIDGVKIGEDLSSLRKHKPPGTLERMTIRREGELLDVEYKTVPHKPNNYDGVPQHLIIALFLLTAWIMFTLRKEDDRALLLTVLLGTMTGLMGGYPPDNLPFWLNWAVGGARTAGVLFFPAFVHSFLIFPDRSPLLRRWPNLIFWIYLPFFVFMLPVLGVSRFSMHLNIRLLLLPKGLQVINSAWGLCTLYLAFGLLCLATNYQAASTDARRRIRVLAAGCAVGAINIFLLIAGSIANLGPSFAPVMQWLDWSTIFTLPLIPLTFAYAIIRHKVLPVSLIIRRGVRYLLVSRGSIFLEILAVSVVLTLLLTLVFERLKPPGILVGLLSAVAGIGAWKSSQWLHDRYLAPIIDRKFFRQSYDAQQIMADLAESLRSTTSIPQLVEQLAVRIQTALQTENVVVLLRDEATGDYNGFSYLPHTENGHGPEPAARVRLPKYSEAAARIEASGQPLEVEPRANHTNGSNSVEEIALHEMNSALLSPLIGKEGMTGIISVGPRLGDTPFSGEDKRLLKSISGPTTFALENARLIQRLMEDSRRRQELEAENEARAKELEEARQLQLSMLPKRLPQLPGLEIAAYMKTATEVGGDYYDFHLREDGVLTIAIGDATGHGLKAGSVVTAAKGLFYSYADEPGPAAALERSSRVLKQMNLRGLFMAMTVVKVRGRRIQLSSAGMPPALIYRAADRSVEEVLFKALPLGSLTNYRYFERELTLETGDILVLESDGLPERFNQQSEMFDYPSVSRVVREAADLSAQEMIDHLVRAGDAWAAGRPQDDDITFVIVKIV